MSIMMVGAFVTRSAGCIINDFWDQDFDRQVREEFQCGEDVDCVIVGGAYQAEADCQRRSEQPAGVDLLCSEWEYRSTTVDPA